MLLKSEVITHFAGLFTLKNKPENLTYSLSTLALLFIVLAAAIKLTVTANIPQFDKINAFVPFFIMTYEVLFLLVLYITLAKCHKKNRFVQAACNFLGVNIFSCACSALIANLPLQLLFVCLSKSWLLVINFHITKHAFNTKQLQAIWIYLFMNITAMVLVSIPFSIVAASYLNN